MYSFIRVALEEIDKSEYYNFEDKLIYQTIPWIEFLTETQKIEPLILRICKDEKFIGYYTGFLFSKFGIKMLGSPFRGWTTLYMGFNLLPGNERAEIVVPLWKYVSKHYKCLYMELIDRYITLDQVNKYNLVAEAQITYLKDISGDINSVFNSFSSTCKNQIRRYEKNSAKFQVCEPTEEFAEKYYKQLTAVFGYQGLCPSYDLNRILILFRKLKELDGALYCTEMCNPEGESIGTLIGFAYNKTCYLFGLASYREEKYYQADYLVWDSFVHWKSEGCTSYDLVGEREYKLKFHPEKLAVPRIICCKARILIRLRNMAEKIYWLLNKLRGKK